VTDETDPAALAYALALLRAEGDDAAAEKLLESLGGPPAEESGEETTPPSDFDPEDVGPDQRPDAD